MRKTIYCLFLLNVSVVINAQNDVDFWDILGEVKFETGYMEGSEVPFDVPVFSKKLKSYEGQIIKLKGYILPVEVGSSDHYILSKLPFNVCYYCGGAGPETIIEIISDEELEASDNRVVIEGMLMLNNSDMNYHMYVLRNAELID
ncbi:hypothetical protein OO013_10425 [Mangrovivirga sp. M17]|uniref:DUF3299 domain-containing protein n=1 Tax=Mangrovivirga halotolerans TaxID=2993936 RepID=A0ABT3RR83_9BACT|nr:hypothetical protein [Mangrovivirga halotolerans]MCX2744284.1 hypothetical protein [Mangrovivirga halotolerans]